MTAALESPTRADRWTIGASIGRSEGEGGADLLTSRGVFARMRLAGKLSIEAEVSRLDRDADASPSGWVPDSGLRGTANLRYDLSTGSFMPYLVFGGGVDNWRTDFVEYGYARREGGVGLDVRITDGLHLGADIRWGTLYYLGMNQTDKVVAQVYFPPPFGDNQNDRIDYVATRLVLSASL